MTIHVCTFASESFLLPQSRQKADFMHLNFPESELHFFTDKDLDAEFYKKVPYASEKNKYGFFTFKPYILEKLLNKIPENDLLIYLDVNDKPLKGLGEYAEMVMSENSNFNILAASTNYPNVRYISNLHRKRLSFFTRIASHFKYQPEAGALIIRNNSETRALLRVWIELTLINSDALNRFDDGCGRWDQETLFLLSIINNSVHFESWKKYRFFKLGIRKYIDWEFYRGRT